jgi:transcriptional regulator with XRE-family HTH domain
VPLPASPGLDEARRAFAGRLREIRREAGLTGRDLARLTGWHSSKISRIEHAVQIPTIGDVTLWCENCKADDQTADLVASLHIVEGMYVEWRRMERTGMRGLQESYLPLDQHTTVTRIYEPGVIPGLFQTRAYATARMARIIEFSGIPDDLDTAVQARMQRQHILQAVGHRFVVVLEEAALRSRIGSRDMMAGQLGHLITVASLHNVSLGIIPADINRTMWSSPGFWIFDNQRVLVETPTAELTITQPRELHVYSRTFTELASMAHHGAAARAMIMTAIAALGD